MLVVLDAEIRGNHATHVEPSLWVQELSGVGIFLRYK